MRAYASYDADALEAHDGSPFEGIGKGMFAILIDQGEGVEGWGDLHGGGVGGGLDLGLGLLGGAADGNAGLLCAGLDVVGAPGGAKDLRDELPPRQALLHGGVGGHETVVLVVALGGSQDFVLDEDLGEGLGYEGRETDAVALIDSTLTAEARTPLIIGTLGDKSPEQVEAHHRSQVLAEVVVQLAARPADQLGYPHLETSAR